MSYLICAVISVFILYYIETNKLKCTTNISIIYCHQYLYNFIFFILLIYWTLLIGLQYEVGSDYNSYKYLFINGTFNKKYEYLFYIFSIFISKYKIHYQLGFILIALLQFLLFLIFLKKIKINRYYLFIFLFFFYCVSFYNQTNTIRQYTASYFLLLSIWYAYKKNFFKYILFIILGSLFHISLLAFLPLYFIVNKILSKHILLFILLISFLFSFIKSEFLVVKLLSLFKTYNNYLLSRYLTEEISLINKLTKYIYIPFYLYSLKFLNYLKGKDRYFYQLGFIFYSLKLFCFSSLLLSRFSMYLEIMAIFPIYYLLLFFLTYKKENNHNRFILFYSFIFVSVSMFLLKVFIFSSGEYAYKSILSNILLIK